MSARRARFRWDALVAALALVAYAPLLWTSPGRVSADTKTYLTLDPGRLLTRTPWLWDHATGLGTVSHQTIGYLFPLGPWYWLASAAGLPDWLAQRLWLGTLFFAAGSGVVALARQLRLPWRAAAVAAFTYQLSPYVLPYAARLSVILLPWAGLGWLMTFTHRSLRAGGWRWPAAAALVVLATGGVNATALVLAGLGPLCLVAWAAWSDRSLTAGRVAGAVGRIGLLSIGVSAWWMAGLWAQGRYGLPILRYTETYDAVARASSPAEVLRGLGYWFGYGRDAVSPWVEPAPAYGRSPALVAVTFAVPAAALASLALTRWRARGLAVLLAVVGTVVSVGAHPMASPGLAGRVLRAFIGSDVGRALRSTPRAVPLVSLGLGLGLGMGVEVLTRRRPRLRLAAPLAAVGLVAAGLPALWTGDLLTRSILRDESLPSWWTEAAAALDRGDAGTRVLEVPGSDFASYRWGGTVDPVLVGLTERDVAARELVPWGSPGSADLLAALDRRWQDRVAEPDALAPLLRRLGVGDVVLRNDLQYERYRLARPRTMAALLDAAPGLRASAAFGPPGPNVPDPALPLLDAEELTTPAGAPDPAPVETYRVEEPRPEVRAAPVRTTVVAGDGEGLVDLAAIGRLDGAGLVRYAGTLVATPAAQPAGAAAGSSAGASAGPTDALDAALRAGSDVVVTDTNRRQGRRWGSVREYLGATEEPGEVALRVDPTDNRLDLFPGTGPSSQTTADVRGVASVRATSYGNPITYTPEDRAVMAVDGDPRTAWRTGAFAEVRGERLEVRLDDEVTTDQVVLLQPLDGPRNRWITGVRLRFDGGGAVDAVLDDTSRTAPGQTVTFPSRRFRTLSIEVTDANFTRLPGYRGISAVGFAEVGIAGVRATEVIRLPADALDRVTDQDLTLLLTRQRASALEANRRDPEPTLRRSFTLPVARTFALTGTGAVSPRATDAVVVAELAPAGVRAVATARLDGPADGTGLAAVDGDASTVWRTPIDAPLQSLTVTAPAAATVDRLALRVVADGRHSVPTALRVRVDGGEPVDVAVAAVPDGPGRGDTVVVPVALPRPLTGRSFEVAVTSVREVRSIDADSRAPVVQPVGVAELGAPGLVARPVERADSACRDDLVRLDDRPVPVRVERTALAVTLAACVPLALDAGEHTLATADGRDVGLDLDRLVLRSPGAAGPGVATRPAVGASPEADALPALTAARTGPVTYRVDVRAADTGPFWLVLGQSLDAGWHATAAGRDLGPPTLVDGYANGWLVQPAGREFTIVLRWEPQRVVWRAIVLSVVATLACLVLVLPGARRRAAPPLAWLAPEPAPGPDARPGRSLPAASAVATVGALVCSGWIAALVVAAVRVVVRRLPARWVRWGHVAPGLCLAAVAAFVVAKQVRYDLPVDLDWPGAFDAVQPLAWAALFLAVPTFRPRTRPGSPAAASSDPAGSTGADRSPYVAAAAAPAAVAVAPTVPVRPRSWPPGVRDDPPPPTAPPGDEPR